MHVVDSTDDRENEHFLCPFLSSYPLSSSLFRYYSAHMHTALPRGLSNEVAPKGLNQAKSRWKKLQVKKKDMVADFKRGFVAAGPKLCNYCGQEILPTDRVRRHGADIIYHLECDPYERQRNPKGARITTVVKKEPSERKKLKKQAKSERKAARAQRRKEREQRRLAKFEKRQEEIRKRNAMIEKKNQQRMEQFKANAIHCKGCGEEFKGGYYYAILGGVWHKDCFRCYECGVEVGSH